MFLTKKTVPVLAAVCVIVCRQIVVLLTVCARLSARVSYKITPRKISVLPGCYLLAV